MHAAARWMLSLCVLMSALASAYYNNGEKLRRDNMQSLFPQPRVGRRSSRALPLPIPLSELHLANEFQYEPIEKRQLYAFPRVGRGATVMLRGALRGAQLQGMPHRRADGPGMWFGPRLGRSFRSEDDDMMDHSKNSERSDPEQIETDQEENDKTQLHTLDTL